jgi:hypothetical protein
VTVVLDAVLADRLSHHQRELADQRSNLAKLLYERKVHEPAAAAGNKHAQHTIADLAPLIAGVEQRISEYVAAIDAIQGRRQS